MKTIYVCNDTVTGIFSAIYDAWKSGKCREECAVALRNMQQPELFCEYLESEETEKKARAVEALIRKHLGAQAYWDIYHAALSKEHEKGDAILGTMMAARQLPDSRKIMEHLSHPDVEKVFELSRRVGGEAHTYKGFLRFRELANGVLYSEIAPENQIVTCLAPHFADRLPLENWMIYDTSHKMFAVHEAKKQWVLVLDEGFDRSPAEQMSEKEFIYARLWKNFCKTIAIEERKNPGCQLQHLPLRYRENMTEMQVEIQGKILYNTDRSV